MDTMKQGTGPSAYQEPSAVQMTYEQFLQENPGIGILKIQASRAQQTIPISGVRILVAQNFSDLRVLFFDGQTDENGMIASIRLPAPPLAESLNSKDPKPGAVYHVYATHPGFAPQHYEIEIFDGVTAILPVTPQLTGEV
ncbi:MAG: hypothetical protein PHY23_09125 [Oscillospiraceae bacterium]|nr:hypothetical protein [Oscillospiraceae bacterium]